MSKDQPKSQVIVELYDIHFEGVKNKSLGHVVTTRSVNEEDLVKIAVARRTDLNAGTLRAAYEILREVAEEELINGASVTFGFGHARLGVNGIFNNDDVKWNPKEHRLYLISSPDDRLRRLMKGTQVKVRGKATVGPIINTITDVASKDTNNFLTIGGMVNMKGVRMKIAGPSPENGLYLTHLDTGVSTFIPPSALAVNHPRSITFTVPASLEPGNYQLSIKTQFVHSQKYLKNPRTYYYFKTHIIGKNSLHADDT